MKNVIKKILRKYYFLKVENEAFKLSFWTTKVRMPYENDVDFDRMAEIGYEWFKEAVHTFKQIIIYYIAIILCVITFMRLV